MRLVRWAAAALCICACGKHADKQSKRAGSGSTVTGSGGTVTAADEDPKAPPPPPLVKLNNKGDCKTDYAPKPKRDPNAMCKVAGGTFSMGETEHVPVKLSPYYIDEFEVTVAQVALYLNATRGGGACTEPIPVDPKAHPEPCFQVAGPDGNRSNHDFIRRANDGTFIVEPGTEHLPYTGATRNGATNYCTWAGKTLPTEAQWDFAAAHDPVSGKDFVFPWGDKFDGKRARCAKDECPDAPGLDPKYGDVEPVAVGTYDGSNGRGDGRSPWGAYDMAGNADELVADCEHELKPCAGGPCVDPPPAGPQPIQSDPPPPPPGTICRPIALGGGVQGEQQLHVNDDGEPQMSGGFRCVRPVD